MPWTFSIIFQLRVAALYVSAAVPAIYVLLEEAWEASILPLTAHGPCLIVEHLNLFER
jgi:hypothetical protein